MKIKGPDDTLRMRKDRNLRILLVFEGTVLLDAFHIIYALFLVIGGSLV